MAGSTTEIAQAVGEEILSQGYQVDVLPLEEVKDLEPYDGVVVGGPMIMGWHRATLRFLKKHHGNFRRLSRSMPSGVKGRALRRKSPNFTRAFSQALVNNR